MLLFFQELALIGLAASGWIVEYDPPAYLDSVRAELRSSDYADDVADYLARTK